MAVSPEAEQLCEEGIRAVNASNTLIGLVYFEKAARLHQTPVICSFLGYCLARERGTYKKALSLCEEAINAEPRNTVHYLNLGRVYVLANQKDKAITTFREGLRFGKNKQIVQELDRLGIRKPPLFSFLTRDNLFNKYLGMVCNRFHLR